MFPKLIEVLKAVIERYPANWAAKIVMTIGVFIIMPIEGAIPHYTNFSFLLVLLMFFIAIFFNLMIESKQKE